MKFVIFLLKKTIREIRKIRMMIREMMALRKRKEMMRKLNWKSKWISLL
jgi:hypothetical protein